MSSVIMSFFTKCPLAAALMLLATGCGPLLSARSECERNPALVAAVDWSTAIWPRSASPERDSSRVG